MLKKVYILSFIFFFVLSTTGIPLSLHLCSMQSSATFESCEMCEEEPAEIQSCCSENSDESQTSINNPDYSCCKVQIVDKKVNDDFSSITELRKIALPQTSFISTSEESYNLTLLKNSLTESPPLLQSSGKIYIDISLLLI